MAQCQGPRAQIRLFWSSPVFGRKILQKSQIAGAQLNVDPAQTITWLVGVTIYCRPTFFNNNLPPTRQFLCNKILLKEISYSKGNAH